MRSDKSKLVLHIEVNDIFEQMSDEIKVLKKELIFANNCLNVFNKFNIFFDKICLKFEEFINLEDKQELNQLKEEFNTISKNKEFRETNSNIDFEQQMSETNDKKCERNIVTFEKRVTQMIDSKATKTQQNYEEFSDTLISIARSKQKIDNTSDDSNVRRNRRTKRQIYSIPRFIKPKIEIKPKPKPKVIVIPEPEDEPNSLLLMRRNNFDEKTQTYVCPNPYCEKSYSTHRKLYIHFRLIHYKQKEFFCEEPNCNKGFKTSAELKSHSISHSNVRLYSCPVKGCAYECKRPKDLVQHSTVHTNIKAFKCEECGKTYKLMVRLKRHQLVHKIEPSFKCYVEGCHQFLKSKYDLERHKKLVHNILRPLKKCEWPGCEYQTRLPGLFKAHKMVHTGEKPYVCEWPDCGKRFRALDQRYRHMLVHKDLKPYACIWPGCQYRCRTLSNLKLHLRVHQK